MASGMNRIFNDAYVIYYLAHNAAIKVRVIPTHIFVHIV